MAAFNITQKPSWTSSEGFNHLKWPETPIQWCKYFHELDARFNTWEISPIHHDNRCNYCKDVTCKS